MSRRNCYSTKENSLMRTTLISILLLTLSPFISAQEEEQQPVNILYWSDIQNTGGLSVLVSYVANQTSAVQQIVVARHNGNPLPATPIEIQVTATPPDPYGYRNARVSWKGNTERDLVGYELWRRVTGICGDGVWRLLTNLGPAAVEYTDPLTTVGPGDCTAEYRLRAKDAANQYSDWSNIVSIQFSSSIWKANDGNPGTSNKPMAFDLHEAYPNPFNPSTQITFDLPEDGFVALSVYDVLGRKVADLANSNYVAGYHSVVWNAANISSGMYFIHFSAIGVDGGVRLSKVSKVLLTK
jgi:hypothetical protein